MHYECPLFTGGRCSPPNHPGFDECSWTERNWKDCNIYAALRFQKGEISSSEWLGEGANGRVIHEAQLATELDRELDRLSRKERELKDQLRDMKKHSGFMGWLRSLLR